MAPLLSLVSVYPPLSQFSPTYPSCKLETLSHRMRDYLHVDSHFLMALSSHVYSLAWNDRRQVISGGCLLLMARLRLSRCVVKHTFVWLADAHVLLLLHMYTYEQNVSVTKVSKVISFALTPRWRIVSLALSYPTEVHCARRTHQFLLLPTRVCGQFFYSDDAYRQV